MKGSEFGMSYSKIVDVYEELDTTTKRLEKTTILSKFLADIGENDPKLLPIVTLLALGRVFPTWSEEELGIGTKLLMKAIALVVGVKPEDVETEGRRGHWKGCPGTIYEKETGNPFLKTPYNRKGTEQPGQNG
jgi:hypothetical protein